jgi:quercetin dioxygenase-like cupin family protein
LTLHGKKEPHVPVHIHTRYHETFFVAKGAINLYANNQTRGLGPLDIGSVPPNTNHAFELLELDTEVLGAVTPGGFSFYQQVGDNYAPTPLAPWPVDPLPPAIPERVLNATGLRFDYNPTNYSLVYNVTNGTSDMDQPWHNGNNKLPGSLSPYFVAGGWGPKYLHQGLGQVVHLYMTGAESDGVMVIATIAMRAARGNETAREFRSDTSAQLFRPLEGQLHIRMQGQTIALGTGDLAVVPAGVSFSYWSEVAYTRVYHVAATLPGTAQNTSTFGVTHELLAGSKPWDYAIFPDTY